MQTKIPGMLVSEVPEGELWKQGAFIGQSATRVIIFATLLLEKGELFNRLP